MSPDGFQLGFVDRWKGKRSEATYRSSDRTSIAHHHHHMHLPRLIRRKPRIVTLSSQTSRRALALSKNTIYTSSITLHYFYRHQAKMANLSDDTLHKVRFQRSSL